MFSSNELSGKRNRTEVAERVLLPIVQSFYAERCRTTSQALAILYFRQHILASKRKSQRLLMEIAALLSVRFRERCKDVVNSAISKAGFNRGVWRTAAFNRIACQLVDAVTTGAPVWYWSMLMSRILRDAVLCLSPSAGNAGDDGGCHKSECLIESVATIAAAYRVGLQLIDVLADASAFADVNVSPGAALLSDYEACSGSSWHENDDDDDDDLSSDLLLIFAAFLRSLLTKSAVRALKSIEPRLQLSTLRASEILQNDLQFRVGNVSSFAKVRHVISIRGGSLCMV